MWGTVRRRTQLPRMGGGIGPVQHNTYITPRHLRRLLVTHPRRELLLVPPVRQDQSHDGMNCPKCLEATKVLDSRMPTKDSRGYLTRFGHKAIGWWSSDYRVRKRLCKACELAFYTVEISVEDLEEALKDAKSNEKGRD